MLWKSGNDGCAIRVSRTGSPDTLYVYDTLGNVAATALDVDGNAQVSYAGTDRITATAARYEQISNAWWRVTSSAVWNQTGVDACLTAAVTRVRMTGLGTDTYNDGILTAQTESIDWLGNVTRTSTYTDAANANVWTVTETPGSVQPAVQKTVAGHAVSMVSSTAVTNTYAYDGFARQSAATDGRGNISLTAYNSLGQVDYTEDAVGNRTLYDYDAIGRRTAVTDPLSNTVFTAYDSLGNVIRSWGATYPVEYGYDTQGRKISMKTFRVENGNGDETRWLYDNVTGLLTNKVYADGKGTAYGYTPAGKLASRIWARGVTTEYSYDALGQFADINYSDSTPDVTFVYDRLGRMTSAVTAVSSNLFQYSGLDLVGESQNGVTVARAYDELGRSSGVGLGDDYAVNYDYDGFGRLSSVVSSVFAVSFAANYSYLTGTDFTVSMTNSAGFLWWRVYENNRNLIASVGNGFRGSTVSDFAYSNDADGRRVRRVDSGAVTNHFGLNARSEVVSAFLGGSAYAYGYDCIGNRLFSAFNAETNAYFTNPLNQYTNITDGVAITPAYDADGNMTSCGLWSYTWDAENRMVSASSNGMLVVTDVYDHQSRRISKITLAEVRTYIWDGWNPIRETVLSAGGVSTNHYVWGLDLSGSIQSAGGVGGLLAAIKGSVPYHPAYDANGNVTDYVDTNGSVVAHREYSPFGETVLLTDSSEGGFLFWWSTKPYCPISGLNEYEYRRQDPITGRWLSRDPVGESGGINVYGFVANSPLDSVDYLGYLAVDHRAPDPRKLTPILLPADYFTSLKFARDDGSMPAEGETLGSTTYGSGVISCECACKKGDKKRNIPAAYNVSCKVSWSTEIRLSLLLGKKGLPRAFGHEQRHVLAVKSNIESLIVKPLSMRPDTFSKHPECSKVKDKYENDYIKEFQKILSTNVDRHGVDGHPDVNTFYDPLAGTEWQVPAWIK